MAQSLAPNLARNNLNTTFFTNNTAMLHALVFAAVAFVVLDRTKNLGAEQAIALRLEGPVVNGFRLFHLAKRTLPDFIRRGQ